jgi:hypothetical protein
MPSARVIIQIAVSAAILFGSFFITLWLTAPDSSGTNPQETDNRSDTQRLADRRISDSSDLLRAAQEIGLHLSRRMEGNVDLINRISQSDVNMVGWVADAEGDATPAKILVFVGGAIVGSTQPKGERPDVTEALKLSFGSEKNTSFSVNFKCRSSEQPIVVGIGTAKRYVVLKSGACP